MSASGQVPAPDGSFDSVRRSGVTIYQGKELSYEVVNGLALHGGDMVLGTAEQVVAASRRRRSQNLDADRPKVSHLSPVDVDHLWPGGTIPYVIDSEFTEQAVKNIQAAIEEWNSKTVIHLVPRSTQRDYVRFQSNEGAPLCFAALGRQGGEQGIWLSLSDGCGVSAAVHEIGHAVGLHHEHQRIDRDNYIAVSDEAFNGNLYSAYIADAPKGGPYDYASIMHYGSPLETIPPGIPVNIEGLSSGDIDGVARMYGKSPTTTTISTNPPGLEMIVDGERVVTPAHFDWSPGTRHVLYAPSPQIVGNQRFLFGRWNDEAGNDRRSVTADSEATWFEANFILQQRLLTCVDPPETGTVTIWSDSVDDYHTLRTFIGFEANPAPDGLHEFRRWRSRGMTTRHGLSSNPATGSVRDWESYTYWRSHYADDNGIEYAARFSTGPLFLIDSNVDGVEIRVDGDPKRLPWAFPVAAYQTVTIQAPEIEPEDSSSSNARYRFNGWSNGEDRIHEIEVPEAGGAVRLDLTPEYHLRTRARNYWREESPIRVSPQSEDGFYPAGTQVLVTAVPPEREYFAGWTGSISGTESVQTVVMDAPKALEAIFTPSRPIQPGEEKKLVLAARNPFNLHSSEDVYHVFVPPDAIELTVSFRSPFATDVDLYVRRGQEIWWEPENDGKTLRIIADFESTSGGPNETIVVNRGSTPPLANDIFHIGLTAPPRKEIQGTLSVEIRRSGIVGVNPRALTFVSPSGYDPAPQTIRLVHEPRGSFRYRIESDQHWLAASPQEWDPMVPGTTQVDVMVNSEGVADGTHNGTLTVRVDGDRDLTGEGSLTAVEIPVSFATVSPVGLQRNDLKIFSHPQNGDAYGAGEKIRIGVGFSGPVEVRGNPVLELTLGSHTQELFWNGDGQTTHCGGYSFLYFDYVVQAEDWDPDGISIAATALRFNGGSIRSLVGSEDADLDLSGFAIIDDADHKVNGSLAPPPQVSGLEISSRPQNGDTYGAGEKIGVWVAFTMPVEVTGSPVLEFTVGNRTRQVPVVGAGGDTLWFDYRVQAEDRDPDGISIAAGALRFNGGNIRSVASGAEADLDLSGRAIIDDAKHKVDGALGIPPQVSRVGISSRPQNGDTYGAGEMIVVWVEFTVPINVTGTPVLEITVGTRTRRSPFYALGETDGVVLAAFFRYRVQAADRDPDGISVAADALRLNGGSIRSSVSGADAILQLGDHAILNDAEHKVDGSLATIPSRSENLSRD